MKSTISSSLPLSITLGEEEEEEIAALIQDLDTFWVLFGTPVVFLFQVGFSMIEVGSVSVKNTRNILMKNIGDACIGAVCWWLVGHGVAFGEDYGGFIGTKTRFALKGSAFESEDGTLTNGHEYAVWVFQWTFAATTSTIVSGAVAERIDFNAYIVYSAVLTAFIYPVVVHWAWSGGWASASIAEEDLLFGCGLLDFAGSGVVHGLGGLAALCACAVVGPRVGRFNADGTVNTLPQQSTVLQTLGTLILWLGWHGFNGVSTLALSGGGSAIAAKVMVMTTISGGSGAITNTLLRKRSLGYWDSGAANTGLLAGLVGITAGCSTVEPEGAMVIGIVAAIVYAYSSKLMLKLQIDDVVDAAPIHFFCGVWGVISASLFATKDNYAKAYDADRADKCAGVFYGGDGSSLGAGAVFMLAVVAWTAATCMVLFVVVKFTLGIRVSREMENVGMDDAKHGGQTYPEMNVRDTLA